MADFVEQADQPKEIGSELAVRSYLHELGLQWNDLLGKTVLHVGTGDEAFVSEAKNRGVQVVSVNTVTGGMRSIPDDSFDLIVSRNGVRSMEDLQADAGRMLSEAKRALKSGGEFRFGACVLEPAFQTHEAYANQFGIIEVKVKGNKKLTGYEAAFWNIILQERARQEKGIFENSPTLHQLDLLHNQQKAQEVDPHLSLHAVEGGKDKYTAYYVLKKPEAQQAVAA